MKHSPRAPSALLGEARFASALVREQYTMPRAIRCNLPNQPYECSTRTANEQFLLNPYAVPGCFLPKYDKSKLGDKKRLERQARIAEHNAEKLRKLIIQLKAWQNSQAPEPQVTPDTLPETVNNIIGTWLAKAIDYSSVDFYGTIVMSDHPHHLLSHKQGRLDTFFEYFNGQVARALNRFYGRRHQLWSRRYSAIPILDEQTDIERLIYFLTNPQKADLVDKIEQWPGISSAQFHLGDSEDNNEYLFFDRTAWHRAKSPKAIARFLKVVRIKYAVLPALAHLPAAKRKQLLRRLVEERESQLRAQRQIVGKRVLGKQGLKQTDSKGRPQNPKIGSCPLCLCSDKELRMKFIDARSVYEAVYREQTQAYRESKKIMILQLPLGSYPPPKLIHYQHTAKPERSALSNLLVR